jgi:hypothetical protein
MIFFSFIGYAAIQKRVFQTFGGKNATAFLNYRDVNLIISLEIPRVCS